jgi:hypothetical protein
MKPDIKYNLHDSLITDVLIGPRKEMNISVDLYSIYYPGDRKVKLRFGGILNFETVSCFAEKLRSGLEEDREFSWRIDGFQYDTKEPSSSNNLYFFLQVEHLGGIRIHCSKMTVNEGEPPASSDGVPPPAEP